MGVELDVRVQIHRLGEQKMSISSERYVGEFSTPREEVEEYFTRKHLAPGEVCVRKALYDDTFKDCWPTLVEYQRSLRDMSGNAAVPCTMQIVIDGCGGGVTCDGDVPRSSDVVSADWYSPRKPTASSGGTDISFVPGDVYDGNAKHPVTRTRPTICDQSEHRLRGGLNEAYRSIYDNALAELDRLKKKDAAEREACHAYMKEAGFDNCELVDEMRGFHTTRPKTLRPFVKTPTHYGGTHFRGSTPTINPMVGTIGHPGPYRYPAPHTVSTVGSGPMRATRMAPLEFLVKSEQGVLSGSE